MPTLALEGTRVIEFSIGIAGPTCGRYLAHYGAEVIKIEASRRPDSIRLYPSSWVPEDYGQRVRSDTGPMWTEFNAGKLSAAIDVTRSEGLDIVRRLITQTDVFLVNFSAPTVAKWGLDYEAAREIKPDIVYISLPGFGNVPGPYRDYRVWGPNLGPLAGIDHLTGWPDRPASGIASISYPDYTNGFHAFFAVLCALDYRARTGTGQYIDMSQYEATAGCLGQFILDYVANGTAPGRTGNRAPTAAPQGVYPCRGEDRWVAITVSQEQEWLALCRVAGHPEWAEDDRFIDMPARQEHHDELDELIAAWTSGQTPVAVAEQLQQAGVAAAPVEDMRDLAHDDQLEARDFWKLVEHARFGADLVSGHPIRLSDTPARFGRGGPAMGQDNDHVLKRLCGYSDEEVQKLVDQGVVEPVSAPKVRLRRPYWSWVRNIMPYLQWPDSE